MSQITQRPVFPAPYGARTDDVVWTAPAVGDRVRVPATTGYGMSRIGRVAKILRGIDAGFAQVVEEGTECPITALLSGLTVLGGAS